MTTVAGPSDPALMRRVLAERIRELVRLTVSAELTVDELGRLDERLAAITTTLAEREAATAAAPTMREYVGDPVEGTGNPLAPPLADISAGVDGARARVRFDVQHQGAPGRAHGGWVSAVLDQIAGRASAGVGKPAMTGRLTVHYHRATPLLRALDVEAVVGEVDGRKLYVDARILHEDVVTASASALMVTVPGLQTETGAAATG